MVVNKRSRFIRGFIIGLAAMIFMVILIVPVTLWMMGIWPAWTMISYFITIPTISGACAASLN